MSSNRCIAATRLDPPPSFTFDFSPEVGACLITYDIFMRRPLIFPPGSMNSSAPSLSVIDDVRSWCRMQSVHGCGSSPADTGVSVDGAVPMFQQQQQHQQQPVVRGYYNGPTCTVSHSSYLYILSAWQLVNEDSKEKINKSLCNYRSSIESPLLSSPTVSASTPLSYYDETLWLIDADGSSLLSLPIARVLQCLCIDFDISVNKNLNNFSIPVLLLNLARLKYLLHQSNEAMDILYDIEGHFSIIIDQQQQQSLITFGHFHSLLGECILDSLSAMDICNEGVIDAVTSIDKGIQCYINTTATTTTTTHQSVRDRLLYLLTLNVHLRCLD